MADEDAAEAPPAPPASTRGWRRSALVVTVVVVLVVGVPALVRPADAFSGGGGEYDVQLAPGEQVIIGLALPSRRVQVTDVRPIVSEGIQVRVSIRRCPLIETTLGSVRGVDIDRFCLVPPPVEGLPAGAVASAHLLDEAEGSLAAPRRDPGRGDAQLVAVIEPLEAGTVTIEEIELTHGRGPFHRTEPIAPLIRIEADPAHARP